MRIFLFVICLAYSIVLVPAATVSANGIYEPSVVIIQDGNVLKNANPNAGVPVPKGSKVAIDSFNGHLVIAIAKPGDPVPAGGAGVVPQPDTTKPRIQTPEGKVFEIPDPNKVSSITEENGKVRVEYKDGSVAEVPGTHLPSGAPNPDPANDADAEIQTDAEETLPNDEAQALIIDIFNEPWMEAFYGAPLHLSDFDHDFAGGDTFYIARDVLHWRYYDDSVPPQLEVHDFGLEIGEPFSLLLLGMSLFSYWVKRKKIS